MEEVASTVEVLSVFAVYYVVAQVIERILETLKNCCGYYEKKRAELETLQLKIEKTKERIKELNGDTEIKDLDLKIEITKKRIEALNGDTKISKDYNDLLYDELSLLLTKEKTGDNLIVAIFFVVSAALGFVFAYFLDLKFLDMLNVSVGKWWDIGITGLVVGGGTKPLHDLISYIEKAKE